MSISKRLSYELQSLGDRQQFLDAALDLLSRLIPSDAVAWNAVDEASRTVEICGNPSEVYDDPMWASRMSMLHDNPMVRSYLDAPPGHRLMPRRMSDIVTMSDLHRTDAYNELFHPLGIEHELTVLTARPTTSSGRCWAFTRSVRDFTEAEVALIVAAQPMLTVLDQVSRTQRPRPGPDVDTKNLSPRELEVLRHISVGYSPTTIAGLLRISTATVRKHEQNIRTKLATNNRVQTVNAARKLGLVADFCALAT